MWSKNQKIFLKGCKHKATCSVVCAGHRCPCTLKSLRPHLTVLLQSINNSNWTYRCHTLQSSIHVVCGVLRRWSLCRAPVQSKQHPHAHLFSTILHRWCLEPLLHAWKKQPLFLYKCFFCCCRTFNLFLQGNNSPACGGGSMCRIFRCFQKAQSQFWHKFRIECSVCWTLWFESSFKTTIKHSKNKGIKAKNAGSRMEARSKRSHRSVPSGSIWQMGGGRQAERMGLEEVGEEKDQVGWGWKDEDDEVVEMFAGGGEASVLSVQQRTNPKHAPDYSRGMKMHNCERAACSYWRTWEIYSQKCSEHHWHLCRSTRTDTHAKKKKLSPHLTQKNVLEQQRQWRICH